MTGPWLGWWPTGLNWKSKAIERVPPVSIKFKGTVIHGNGGVFYFRFAISDWLLRTSTPHPSRLPEGESEHLRIANVKGQWAGRTIASPSHSNFGLWTF